MTLGNKTILEPAQQALSNVVLLPKVILKRKYRKLIFKKPVMVAHSENTANSVNSGSDKGRQKETINHSSHTAR